MLGSNFASKAMSAWTGMMSGWRGSLFEATQTNGTVPYQSPIVEDINKSLTTWDYAQIVSASRRLYANSGVGKSVDEKAMYAVGRAWLPIFQGKNKDWGKRATEWLVEKYYPISDVRGSVYDFRTNLYLDSINVDVSGDFGVLFTKSETGWPQTQRIPSHRISSCGAAEGMALENGDYKGLIIRNGIIYNKTGRTVAYRIKTDDVAGFADVSARDFIHTFDPSWYDQGRGIPAFTHALNDLQSLKTTQGFEQMALQILSSIGIVEENEEGSADPNDPAVALVQGACATQRGITTKTLFGGLYKYFKAGSGSKLTTLEHGRPGPNWESFWNRVLKMSCLPVWPYELLWAINTLGGATLRACLAKANRLVEDRQDLLRPGARREVQRAIACAIKLGELPDEAEWYKWGFTLPARITVDIGREAQQEREDFKMGLTTLQDVLEPQGQTVEDHYRQLAHEYRMKQELAAELGVPVDVFGGTSTAPTVPNPADKTGGGQVKDSPAVASAEEISDMLANSGVAMRAGLLTPTVEDERSVRAKLGLPEPSAAVMNAWKEDGDVRRPITLQGKDGAQSVQQPIEQ